MSSRASVSAIQHLMSFVSSSREKIEAAEAAWREGDRRQGPFDHPPDDREELIPLPEGARPRDSRGCRDYDRPFLLKPRESA